ncbi:hypothetical protein [Vibrio jasicida]
MNYHNNGNNINDVEHDDGSLIRFEKTTERGKASRSKETDG